MGMARTLWWITQRRLAQGGAEIEDIFWMNATYTYLLQFIPTVLFCVGTSFLDFFVYCLIIDTCPVSS